MGSDVSLLRSFSKGGWVAGAGLSEAKEAPDEP
jgi:hypothetical protein